MISYFEENMKFASPIVFLCGPYYNESDDGERRTILLDFFDDKFNRRIIPLIIDDFVTPSNIKDDSINVKLLEEIFASISSKTYMFLDTLSAASELGLFASDSTSNKIYVMMPHTSDIIENKVGQFITDVILGQNGEHIEHNYYRPKIIKRAIATNFIQEHYGFINNKIPREIEEKILRDSELDCINKQIDISNVRTEIPQEFAKFSISMENDSLNIAMSIKTLFYIVVAFLYKKYKRADLKDESIDKMEESFIDETLKNIKKTIALSLSIKKLHKLYDHNNVNIVTSSKQDTRAIIKHMLKFIILYHENEPRNGKMFITDADKVITIADRNLKKNPYELFALNENLLESIYKIGENPDDYFEEFEIRKHKKKRTLCRYKKDDYGEKAKELHNHLLNNCINNISLSDNSYAYQKGKSIVKCVEQHVNSICFIKLDIRKYFNSINLELLIATIIEKLEIDNLFKEHIKTIIKSTTYKNMLPLGFTVSPMLTEIYMKSFDEKVVEYVNIKGYVYTRYADDIMISSDELIDDNEKDIIISDIEELLFEKKLKLNKPKSRFVCLYNKGSHVKYLGINIIKEENKNSLSVGKRYRNSVAKEYLEYLELPSDTEEEKITKFYKSRTIEGKIAFIKQVEGDDGFNKVVERIRISTEGRLNIQTNRINFNRSDYNIKQVELEDEA